MSTPARPIVALHQRIPVPCACGCTLPAAYIVIEAGEIVFEVVNRHHGEKHATRISVGQIATTAGSVLAGANVYG